MLSRLLPVFLFCSGHFCLKSKITFSLSKKYEEQKVEIKQMRLELEDQANRSLRLTLTFKSVPEKPTETVGQTQQIPWLVCSQTYSTGTLLIFQTTLKELTEERKMKKNPREETINLAPFMLNLIHGKARKESENVLLMLIAKKGPTLLYLKCTKKNNGNYERKT